MTFSYDDDADVLYVTLGEKTGKRSYVENDQGHILWIDENSQQIQGFTIIKFLRRVKTGEPLAIPEIGPVPFNDLLKLLLYERIEAK